MIRSSDLRVWTWWCWSCSRTIALAVMQKLKHGMPSARNLVSLRQTSSSYDHQLPFTFRVCWETAQVWVSKQPFAVLHKTIEVWDVAGCSVFFTVQHSYRSIYGCGNGGILSTAHCTSHATWTHRAALCHNCCNAVHAHVHIYSEQS